MNDDYVKKWVMKAINDINIAKHELNQPDSEMVTDATCFHCQQSVEKFLKAYLVMKKIDIGKTHNLEFLSELCKKQDIDFGNIDVGNLSFYAVAVRYPDEFYTPSVQEAKECFEIASAVRDFILRKLELDRNI